MTEHDRIIDAYRNCITEPKCRNCPWDECEGECEQTVIPLKLGRYALRLLEEQKAIEPRVMTLEEVKASKGAGMYLEISAQTDEIPYITAAILDGTGTKGVSFYCSQFDFVAYNRRLYGWRCWTSRPTDEQREAAAWER